MYSEPRAPYSEPSAPYSEPPAPVSAAVRQRVASASRRAMLSVTPRIVYACQAWPSIRSPRSSPTASAPAPPAIRSWTPASSPPPTVTAPRARARPSRRRRAGPRSPDQRLQSEVGAPAQRALRAADPLADGPPAISRSRLAHADARGPRRGVLAPRGARLAAARPLLRPRPGPEHAG